MPRVLADVPYGTGTDAVADIHLPDGDAHAGLMVNVHGGGWYTGDKSLATRCSAEFAARGFVVVNANYRILAVDPVPAMVADVLAVLRWVASAAAPPEVRAAAGDHPSVMLTGDSAGAHVALLAAQATVTDELAHALGVDVSSVPRLRGVVSWCGALSLEQLRVDASSEWAERFGAYVEAIAGDEPERLGEYDPVRWMSDSTPPVLAFTSAADFFGESTREYAAVATGVELVDFDTSHPECTHSWQLDPSLAVSQQTYDRTAEFARAHH
jgi:acetyl esterase/lipase